MEKEKKEEKQRTVSVDLELLEAWSNGQPYSNCGLLTNKKFIFWSV